jgi:hypothetical protein
VFSNGFYAASKLARSESAGAFEAILRLQPAISVSVELCVRDNGIGVPAEIPTRLVKAPVLAYRSRTSSRGSTVVPCWSPARLETLLAMLEAVRPLACPSYDEPGIQAIATRAPSVLGGWRGGAELRRQ